MNFYPNEEEITTTVKLLVDKYKISTQLLSKLFGIKEREQANKVLHNLNEHKLTPHDIARLLIIRKGTELFGGSNDNIKKLRKNMLNNLSDQKINLLYETHVVGEKKEKATSTRLTHLAKMKWHPSGPWPRSFVEALGFPIIFAGIRQKETVPTIETIKPELPAPKLVPFQKEIKDKMLEVISQNGNKTRCMVSLPTGGGKTRVAVEAYIGWMHEEFDKGKYLIWIAQSEELCEQAITHLKQMWKTFGYVCPLTIYRYFGGRNLSEYAGGAVVTSIQQLHNRIKTNDKVIEEILKNTGVMIIDEAHRAVSNMYTNLFKKAKELCGEELFPICGLTATPGRAGVNKDIEIKKLVEQFETYLIKPSLGSKYDKNPLQFFRDEGYLASPSHFRNESGREYQLSDDDIEKMKKVNDFTPAFLKKLANDYKRNLHIIKRLLEIPKGSPTLVYACTVEHAYFLSTILNEKGRKAGAISSDTPLTLRRGLIEEFKEKRINFLCNFGVLTTGFDAPKTEYIVICRPTKSEVLYEQIVGRGMRGPKFGGTKTCNVIDFSDNILRFQDQMAYSRFKDFWEEEYQE